MNNQGAGDGHGPSAAGAGDGMDAGGRAMHGAIAGCARAAMNLILRGLALAGASLGLVAIAHAAATTSNEPHFDAGAISGLGARNIGSAAMSGRISALAAV